MPEITAGFNRTPPIPASLHRVALVVAHFVRGIYWRVFHPRIYGCNVVVTNPAGEVLLIRHTYRDFAKWMLPGGGVRRRERPEEAGAREVLEETACRLAETALVRVEHSRDTGARMRIYVLTGTTTDAPVADLREISEARFFSLDAIPDTITRAARRRVEVALAASAG